MTTILEGRRMHEDGGDDGGDGSGADGVLHCS